MASGLIKTRERKTKSLTQHHQNGLKLNGFFSPFERTWAATTGLVAELSTTRTSEWAGGCRYKLIRDKNDIFNAGGSTERNIHNCPLCLSPFHLPPYPPVAVFDLNQFSCSSSSGQQQQQQKWNKHSSAINNSSRSPVQHTGSGQSGGEGCITFRLHIFHQTVNCKTGPGRVQSDGADVEIKKTRGRLRIFRLIFFCFNALQVVGFLLQGRLMESLADGLYASRGT